MCDEHSKPVIYSAVPSVYHNDDHACILMRYHVFWNLMSIADIAQMYITALEINLAFCQCPPRLDVILSHYSCGILALCFGRWLQKIDGAPLKGFHEKDRGDI